MRLSMFFYLSAKWEWTSFWWKMKLETLRTANERMMKQQLESLSIDLDKMPLGSITDRQVRRPSTCMSMSPAA